MVMAAVRKSESDPQVRRDVFGDIAAQDTADSIISVIEMAHNQSLSYGEWWVGARNLPIAGWTRRNTATSELQTE
jgi:hypothetical protein